MKFYTSSDCPIACFSASGKQSVIIVSARNGSYCKYNYDIAKDQKTSRAEIANYDPFKLIPK